MRTLVVIPTFEEAGNIVEVLRRVRSSVPAAEILVVDDSSSDGTAELAEGVGHELGHVEVLRRPRGSGLGSAYKAGFALGLERGYDVMVEMDADLSHDPAALPRLLDALEDGADLVIGSRYRSGGEITQWAAHRRALSKWGCRYANAMLRLGITDPTSGYRAYRATALKALDLSRIRGNGYVFQVEMAYKVQRGGGVLAEVPITFAERAHGESKMSWRIIGEAALLVTGWGIRDRVLRSRAADNPELAL